MDENCWISLLAPEEQRRRIGALGLKAPALIADNANIYYLTGRVFAGYIYLEPDSAPRYMVKRPTALRGEGVHVIRKPEEIPALAGAAPSSLGLELSALSYYEASRLAEAFGRPEIYDVTPALMAARTVKTPAEIALMKADGIRHAEVYSHIPALYSEGMTDIELQTEIEYLSRRKGCLGIFRVSGRSMELHMGSVLTGRNADTPSPYDFAMGGAGMDPSLPVGACGEEIRPGSPVMVDMNGNFNGYMTDMTRVYAFGSVDGRALSAHRCSIDICRELAAMGRPGVEARALYARAEEMAREAGLADCFMGHAYHAGFVGHGVGIQVNELPVLAPRSRDVLAAGNAIAIEPKFVLPGIGAVGIENTYICTPEGLECITPAPEDIISLE